MTSDPQFLKALFDNREHYARLVEVLDMPGDFHPTYIFRPYSRAILIVGLLLALLTFSLVPGLVMSLFVGRDASLLILLVLLVLSACFVALLALRFWAAERSKRKLAERYGIGAREWKEFRTKWSELRSKDRKRVLSYYLRKNHAEN